MATSIAFYTKVLNFECVEYGGDSDPSVSVLMRGGSLLLLSSHGGDGTLRDARVVRQRLRWQHATVCGASASGRA